MAVPPEQKTKGASQPATPPLQINLSGAQTHTPGTGVLQVIAQHLWLEKDEPTVSSQEKEKVKTISAEAQHSVQELDEAERKAGIASEPANDDSAQLAFIRDAPPSLYLLNFWWKTTKASADQVRSVSKSSGSPSFIEKIRQFVEKTGRTFQ